MCGKSWGVENLSEEERCYKLLMAGVDQIGGCDDAARLLGAYEIGVKEHGETWMKKRMQASAKRLLRNIFHTGLVENPYVDIDESMQIIGSREYMEQGHSAQQKSIVLLKNKGNVLPLSKGTKVYIPEKIKLASLDWFGNPVPESRIEAIPSETVNSYFEKVENPKDAEIALVFMDSPVSPAYKDGFVPINLQYREHTSATSREKSVAGNRSILGASCKTDNECDLDVFLDTCEKMEGKPVVVFLTAQNPTVMKEFEPYADAIVTDFGVEKEILLELASGKFEPSALLPCQMPKDMDTVDAQMEDVSGDMEPYTDVCGHTYDFAFGMNWNGIIRDERTEKYRIQK